MQVVHRARHLGTHHTTRSLTHSLRMSTPTRLPMRTGPAVALRRHRRQHGCAGAAGGCRHPRCLQGAAGRAAGHGAGVSVACRVVLAAAAGPPPNVYCRVPLLLVVMALARVGQVANVKWACVCYTEFGSRLGLRSPSNHTSRRQRRRLPVVDCAARNPFHHCPWRRPPPSCCPPCACLLARPCRRWRPRWAPACSALC